MQQRAKGSYISQQNQQTKVTPDEQKLVLPLQAGRDICPPFYIHLWACMQLSKLRVKKAQRLAPLKHTGEDTFRKGASSPSFLISPLLTHLGVSLRFEREWSSLQEPGRTTSREHTPTQLDAYIQDLQRAVATIRDLLIRFLLMAPALAAAGAVYMHSQRGHRDGAANGLPAACADAAEMSWGTLPPGCGQGDDSEQSFCLPPHSPHARHVCALEISKVTW